MARFPIPDPASLDGIKTAFLDVDGVAVHVGRVDGTGSATGTTATDTTAARASTATTTGPADVGVVLLHHFYGNVATWRRVLRRLDAAGIPAVALDRPGFGWSQRLGTREAGRRDLNPYTREFAVRAAREAVRQAGWRRVVVVGSSMGGTLAIELVADLRQDTTAPDVAHLFLLSPAITGDVGMPPPLRPLLRAGWIARVMAPLVRRLSSRMDLERVAGGWHDQRLADQSDIDAYRIPTRLPGWEVGIWQVMTAESPPNLRTVATTLQVPTTVVAGRFDRTIRPRWNQRTARGMGAELVEVDTGHTPQEEAPDLVVDLVRARVAGTVAGHTAD